MAYSCAQPYVGSQVACDRAPLIGRCCIEQCSTSGPRYVVTPVTLDTSSNPSLLRLFVPVANLTSACTSRLIGHR
eukprot:5797807-Pyramimonas_sp.AAC.1